MISVVIPAHNERQVIGECLRSLLAGARPGELEVVVVCNACTDDTAGVARSVGPPVQVLETSVAGKTHALNLGDEAARHFPRFYVDADVRMSIDAVRAVAAVLSEGRVLAAAPQLKVDTGQSTALVRSYYRIWSRLTWAEEALVGSGVYAVSAAGRERFGAFPTEGWAAPGRRGTPPAEDLWFRAQFGRDERRSVQGATFTVPGSRTVGQVVRRKARLLASNRKLAPELAGLPGALAPQPGGFLRVVRREPGLLPDGVVYAAVGVAATLEARRSAWAEALRQRRSRSRAPAVLS